MGMWRQGFELKEEYPIKIPCSAAFLDELSESEHGSYEDNEALVEEGEEPDRPLETHTYVVAKRRKSRLVLESYAEVEDVYYACATGTAQLIREDKPGFLKSCEKVCKALRPILEAHNSKIARYFPSGY